MSNSNSNSNNKSNMIKNLVKANVEKIANEQQFEMSRTCKDDEFVVMIPAKFRVSSNGDSCRNINLGSMETNALNTYSDATKIEVNVCPVCGKVMSELEPCVLIGTTKFHMDCYFNTVESKNNGK